MVNKLVYFLPTFQPLAMGGAETQAKRLAIKIIKLGGSVIFITPGRKDLPKFEIIDSIPIYRFLTFREKLSNYFYSKKKVNSSINNQNICFDYSKCTIQNLEYSNSKIGIKDIILMLDLFISAFFFFLKHRKKFDIVQINTVTFIAPLITLIGVLLRKKILIKDSTMNGLIKMHLTPFPNLARKFIIKHSYFISMTDQIYNNFILSGVSNNKIFKIPNGIEFIQISKSVVTGRFNCLFIGNLYQQPAKGIDVLFLAWKELLLQIPNAKLTIIGDGNIDAYENYLKKLGINESVTLAGRVNPVAHFNSHDLFILPSRREGMSNALMEAMMYGLPVVATNVSGSKDLIQHGINGYLVEVDDKNGLVEAINMALMNNELRVYCSKFNPERIKNLCDMNIVSNKYMHAYDNILQLQ